MMCYISVKVLTLLTLLVICSAQLDTNPVDNDPKILKQPPHHWGTPAPDSGIQLDFVPFRVLASVRREKTTQHLPREAALASASTPEEIILAKRLRESITTKKLGEVYTEQGYEDSKYDHGYHEKHGEYKEKYDKRDKGKVNNKKPDDYEISDSSNQQEVPTTYYPRSYPKHKAQNTNIKEVTNKPKLTTTNNYNTNKYPYYKTAPQNSPLRYATNIDLIPKKGDSEMPFYDSTNYKECPEISPNIKIGPDVESTKGEPRLKGLGDKIDCLKSKYFGDDPFDNPFFKEETVQTISGIEYIPAILLPSESNKSPILFIENTPEIKPSQKKNKNKDQIPRASGTKKKNSEKEIIYPNHKYPATSEHIDGMLPPPLPRHHRYTRELRTRQVYSTRRGGVKFADLDGDGSEIDVASIVTSHRVSPGSKYGARDSESRRSSDQPSPRGRESRTRSRNYEVTELPEEIIQPHTNRFSTSNRGTSRRGNNNNNNNNDHNQVTKEKVFSSTYVPRNEDAELQGEVTTTVFNAVPSEFEVTPRNSIEPENIEAIQREAITEIPRSEYIVPTTSRGGHDSGRSRTRSRPPVAVISEDVFQGRGERRKSETPAKTNSELLRSRNRQTRVKVADNNRAEQQVQQQQVEQVEEQQQFFETVTQESVPVIIPTESIPFSQVPTESFEIPTEKIPIERNTGRHRSTETAKIPTERIPASRQRTERRQQRPVNSGRSDESSSHNDEATTQRVIASRQRSASRRLEAFKSKKQDYTAGINYEPSRHRQRSGTSRASIDPVDSADNADNVSQQTNTRRGSRNSNRRENPVKQQQEQQVEATSSRRNVSRRLPAAAAAPVDESTAQNAAAAPAYGTSTRRGRPLATRSQKEE